VVNAAHPLTLFGGFETVSNVSQSSRYPRLRFMGSKHKLLPWIEHVLADLEFQTALDAFSGSGCVSYLLKTMGKTVHSNDFLRFACDLTQATVKNSTETLNQADVDELMTPGDPTRRFIEEHFRGVFFEDEDNRFLDEVWAHLPALSPAKRALALSALYRSCLKRQPRGVFTVGGLGRYDDGRRDLRLSLTEHFVESVKTFNDLVFDNQQVHDVTCGDVFEVRVEADLVYLDPPYVPRSDDNCYIKRYHFLEGLSSYWEGAEFHPTSKVKKLRKRYTPFSYRREAITAFDRMFARFSSSIIVLSYSSNGYPDLDVLLELLSRYKTEITVHQTDHRYNFGTHSRVAKDRTAVTEYLVIGA
jgi:adenine-specific DNA-methyltransferase